MHRDPTSGIERESVRKSELNSALPTREEFFRIIESIRQGGHRTAGDAADFAELLASSGARSAGASALTWGDVDFIRAQVTLRVTKNGRVRVVPLNPALAELLQRIKSQRLDEPDSATVARVGDIRAALDKACKAVGCPRITRHGMGGLFATICLQSGVDVKTLASWIGHSGGGLLLLQRYAKAAGAHAAQRVSFAPDAPADCRRGNLCHGSGVSTKFRPHPHT